MTYDVYRYIFIGAALLCGIMFLVSAFLFIFLKIPKIISDLSGATARKAIKNIREQNESTGDKAHKVSAFNQARGKLTDKITPSGNIIKSSQEQMYGINTTKISTEQLSPDKTGVETTVLTADENTTVLYASSPETTVLSGEMSAGETAVLVSPAINNETTVLSGVNSYFNVEYEITFIHTDEVIA